MFGLGVLYFAAKQGDEGTHVIRNGQRKMTKDKERKRMWDKVCWKDDRLQMLRTRK